MNEYRLSLTYIYVCIYIYRKCCLPKKKCVGSILLYWLGSKRSKQLRILNILHINQVLKIILCYHICTKEKDVNFRIYLYFN